MREKRDRKGRWGSSRASRVQRHAIEWDARRWEKGVARARANQSISKESTTLLFHKDDVRRVCRCRTPAARSPIFPLSRRRRVFRRIYHHPSLAPYLALSLPVSDRVPLFRVLYYFFYQSARFQDALRPAESCAINHEM